MAIADEQVRFLQCIAEPTRLEILKLLADGEKYVGEIIHALKKEQALISYHLGQLRQCNLVAIRQEAQKVHYRLSDTRLAELLSTIKTVAKDVVSGALQEASDDETKGPTQ